VKTIIAAGAIALAVLAHAALTTSLLESDHIWFDLARPVPAGCTLIVTPLPPAGVLPVARCPIWVNI